MTEPTNREAAPVSNSTNPETRSRGILVGILILTYLATMVLTGGKQPGGPSLEIVILIGCSMSLAVITAIHFSVGKRSLPRIGISILLLAINGILLTIFTASGDPAVALLPAGIAIPMMLVLFAIQSRLGSFSAHQSPQRVFVEGLQFRIWHVLVATTIVALICTVLRAIMPYLLESDVAYVIFTISTILAGNALVAVWALMGQRVGWRFAVSFAVMAGGYALGMYLIPHFHWSPVWFGIVVIPWFAITIHLLLLRRDGYRFVHGNI